MKKCAICGKMNCMFSWESQCYLCQQKTAQSRVSFEIREGKKDSTFDETVIFCPYCGEPQEPADCPDIAFDEGEHEVDCEACGKTFELQTSTHFYYSTNRMEDEA